jgi:uncharacterized integral membrane protein (TIGR00697 family)
MENNISTNRSDIAKEYSKYFLYIAVLFVATLMVSNTVAVKIFQIGPFFFTGAIMIFPISYIFGDILTEVYGYRASRRIIWAGFASLIFMSGAYYFVKILTPAPFWPNQGAYEVILGLVPRIVLASIVGYFVGEFSNSYVLSKIKIWTKGKHLWFRTISSTIVGEAADTILFATIGFVGVIPLDSLILVILSGYVAKVLIEVLLTPVTYFIVRKLKQLEGVDIYDYDVNYNPFKLK